MGEAPESSVDRNEGMKGTFVEKEKFFQKNALLPSHILVCTRVHVCECVHAHVFTRVHVCMHTQGLEVASSFSQKTLGDNKLRPRCLDCITHHL